MWIEASRSASHETISTVNWSRGMSLSRSETPRIRACGRAPCDPSPPPCAQSYTQSFPHANGVSIHILIHSRCSFRRSDPHHMADFTAGRSGIVPAVIRVKMQAERFRDGDVRPQRPAINQPGAISQRTRGLQTTLRIVSRETQTHAPSRMARAAGTVVLDRRLTF